MIFVAAGYEVHLYDVISENVDTALNILKKDLERLESQKLLRGTLNAAQQLALIHKANNLKEVVDGAIHVQECVFEDLTLKRKVFAELDAIASDTVVLSSSSSCIMPSHIFEGLKHNAQMLVSHPVNPPYFVPLVEIVPSQWTRPEICEQTRELLTKVNQKPVMLKKEVPGFIVNRVQYAILNECYRLIEDKVISVEDVDSVMSNGLGMRYAFMGPWETAHLNATGMKDYFARYAQSIYDVSMDSGPVPKMEGATAQCIIDELTKKIPEDKLQERRKWRDERLIQLSLLKKQMKD